MFKQERVIPAVALLIFAFSVVGQIWGSQLGIAGTLPPLIVLAVIFLAYMLWVFTIRLQTSNSKSSNWGEWMALVLGAATLTMMSYGEFVGRNSDGQQAGFSCFCGGFLALLFILFVLLDVLRRCRQEEPAGNPTERTQACKALT